MLFGAHCSTSGGVHTALTRAHDIGAEICQIFVKNNMRWFGSVYAPTDIAEFARLRKAHKFAAVFGHAGYLINLAAPDSKNRETSLMSLLQEMQFADQLGLPFLVLHPGAHLGAGEERGLEQIVAGLDHVFTATAKSRVRIALENTAGQGSCLGHQIEHLAAIYDRVQKPERLALCIDTAHLFASGYDIRTEKGWEETVSQIDRLIGRKQIQAFHLNDSKVDLGSHVDRHQHIGQGKIGLDAFRRIVNDPRFAKTPGCLETPKTKDLHEDIENLRVLRSLVSSSPG